MDLPGDRPLDPEGAPVTLQPLGAAHRGLSGRLFVTLDQAARAAGMRAHFAPLAWRVTARRAEVADSDLVLVLSEPADLRYGVGPATLVVEIARGAGGGGLPERRALRSRVEGQGAPWYWVVDPDEPSLTVLRLEGGEYEEIARVTGAQPHEASEPFPVRVVPAELAGYPGGAGGTGGASASALTLRGRRGGLH